MSKEFLENTEGVHLMYGEFTLCGDSFDIAETERDGDHDGTLAKTTKHVVTCERCKAIIVYCRGTRVATSTPSQSRGAQ